MFTELNDLLDISPDKYPTNHIFTVIEGSVDSAFVTHNFISFCLRTGKKICLVSAAQSLSHYHNVAQKLGLNLRGETENGNVKVIEVFKIINKLTSSDDCSSNVGSECNNSGEKVAELRTLMRTLYEQISECVHHFATETCIIIDDLSVLLFFGIDLTDLRFFQQYMKSLIHDPKLRTSLVQLIHTATDLSTDEMADEDLEHFARYACHMSDTVVMVTGLPSGYCKDVHGQITVQRRRTPSMATVSTYVSRKMHFRVLDKTVKLYPIGLSTAAIGL